MGCCYGASLVLEADNLATPKLDAIFPLPILTYTKLVLIWMVHNTTDWGFVHYRSDKVISDLRIGQSGERSSIRGLERLGYVFPGPTNTPYMRVYKVDPRFIVL